MSDSTSFRRSIEGRNLDQLMASFAEDAVLHSPITFQLFEGRRAIRQLLGIILEVFEDFHYTDELNSHDGTKALIFRAKVAGRDVEGLDLLRFDPSGLIRELTVMVRPRSAVEALLAQVGPRLAAAKEAVV